MKVEGKENFLLTLDKAKGVVDQQPWEITPTNSRSKSYNDISLDLHLSPALIRTVCDHIGMESSQRNIQEKIDETRYNKVWFNVTYLYFLLFLFSFLPRYSQTSCCLKKPSPTMRKKKPLLNST